MRQGGCITELQFCLLLGLLGPLGTDTFFSNRFRVLWRQDIHTSSDSLSACRLRGVMAEVFIVTSNGRPFQTHTRCPSSPHPIPSSASSCSSSTATPPSCPPPPARCKGAASAAHARLIRSFPRQHAAGIRAPRGHRDDACARRALAHLSPSVTLFACRQAEHREGQEGRRMVRAEARGMLHAQGQPRPPPRTQQRPSERVMRCRTSKSTASTSAKCSSTSCA